MGNTGSNKTDSLNSSESESSASSKDGKVSMFCIGSRKEEDSYRPSHDELPPVLRDKVLDSNASSTSETLECFPRVFEWKGSAKEVLISGTFSGWKPIPMVKSQDRFALIIEVPEGEYEYKFQVDGKWRTSPKKKDLDTKNNKITVKKSDYDLNQVLEDMQAEVEAEKAEGKSNEPVPSNLPEMSYSQVIPKWTPSEKKTKPPGLPAYLRKVTFNTNEPVVLPMPNRVMVKHVYALAIKDGVMVLSATLRFRERYVNTVLYKSVKGA